MYSKYEHVSKDLMTQVRHARYGIMTFVGFFFVTFLLITGPIWMTLFFFNLTVIIALYYTFFYTNVSASANHDSK